jgi:hypothetical protein
MVRAADDFAAIRARVDELRREREAAAVSDRQTTIGPRPYTVSSKLAQPGLRGQLLRALNRGSAGLA